MEITENINTVGTWKFLRHQRLFSICRMESEDKSSTPIGGWQEIFLKMKCRGYPYMVTYLFCHKFLTWVFLEPHPGQSLRFDFNRKYFTTLEEL